MSPPNPVDIRGQELPVAELSSPTPCVSDALRRALAVPSSVGRVDTVVGGLTAQDR